MSRRGIRDKQQPKWAFFKISLSPVEKNDTALWIKNECDEVNLSLICHPAD
jgi:hypothetical protein